ncbi:MAG: 2'-5' RNA ligase family protein [Porticoccaceae bacterium]
MNICTDRIRCFIGCPVSRSDQAALAALLQSRAGAGWRLIPATNHHLTLCFLGDQSPVTLSALAERLRNEVPRRPCRGHALALAPFPMPTAPLLALELVPDKALLALRAGVVRCVAGTGIRCETAEFRPHISLARGAGEVRAETIELDLSFNELCLYRSIRTSAGSRYRRLVSIALGTPQDGANGLTAC